MSSEKHSLTFLTFERETPEAVQSRYLRKDEKNIQEVLDGGRKCVNPSSEKTKNFFEDEMYWDVGRDGCVPFDVIQRFKNDHWFKPTLKQYGINVELK